MKSTQIFKLFLFVWIAFNSNLSAFAQKALFNVGIKLGYAFGEKGGFVFGLEASASTNYTSAPTLFPGVVFDLDFNKHWIKTHIGVEASDGNTLLGLDIGPTLIIENKNADLGFSIIPFWGLFAYPYYGITIRKDGTTNIEEVGTYLKAPIYFSGFQYH